jgi:hypothetical protein
MIFLLFFFLNRTSCLQHDGRFYHMNLYEELLKTDVQTPFGLYYTCDPDDNESDEEDYEVFIGHGDFYIYNLMLLSILPPLSSTITNMFVTIGYIITVQIDCEATRWIDYFGDRLGLPGFPLPVVIVSTYAVILDALIEY